jgi:DNA-binding XRE family transcriptional regulator
MQNYEEIWKDVPGYEGRYQVSNLGRVKSLNYNQTGKERIMKEVGNSSTYLRVGLCKYGKVKTNKIHRLVMLAFVGESDLQVNHKNGIKTDNRLKNLEYCTQLENIRHAINTGLINTMGENQVNSKLKTACAERIKYGHQGMTQESIAKIYGVSRRLIGQIRSGKKWAHI